MNDDTKIMPELNMTRQQVLGALKLFQRNPDGSKGFDEFLGRVVQGWDCLMIQWCGMWIGIEKDGYTHS